MFPLQELLALEEHIGDVNTGLAKGQIVDKLKTSLYVPGASCMFDQSSESSTENEACIICQVFHFHYNLLPRQVNYEYQPAIASMLNRRRYCMFNELDH